MSEIKNDVILKVEDLSMFFKMGRRYLHAVDHVNFEINKGEVFGLVGESGCGKTTTGRTIIKLYNATGGNVYFKGERIVAGIVDYKEAIKNAKANYKAKVAEGSATEQDKADLEKFIAEQKELIKSAKYDHKYCNRDHARKCVEKLKQERLPVLQELKAKLDEVRIPFIDQLKVKFGSLKTPEAEKFTAAKAEYSKYKKAYRHDLKVAKNERIVNQIQMIFQDPIGSLDPRMTVREIISEGLAIKGITDKQYIDEKVYDVLEKVGLVREHANRYPHEFSGGQRQRIGVARSIIMNPDIIIADEPVSALDVSIQAQVINLLNELRHEMGLTILFVAHDLSVVKYFSDKIGVMYYGKMVEMASSDELFAHPCHPYTKALLSAIPLPDPNYEKQRTRIVYNPLSDHDYRYEQPVMQEVVPGHFVLCNSEEKQKYLNEINK